MDAGWTEPCVQSFPFASTNPHRLYTHFQVTDAKKLNAGTLSERKSLQKDVDAAAAKLDSLIGDHGAKYLKVNILRPLP